MSSFEFQPVKDAELTWVDARLTMRGGAATVVAAVGQNARRSTVAAILPGVERASTDSPADGEDIYMEEEGEG